jgi:hypothetical protein
MTHPFEWRRPTGNSFETIKAKIKKSFPGEKSEMIIAPDGTIIQKKENREITIKVSKNNPPRVLSRGR